MKVKEEAIIKYERALKEGKKEEARIYAQATSSLKEYMTEDSKRLLTLLGIPWVQAPGEGEAQAAYLTKKGESDYCASQDYDSLLFGSTRLIRNLTISGRRKLPRKKVYVEVVPEMINLNQVLRELEITYEQLIDVGILVGTDFNPDGVRGVGPKTALKLIKEKGSLEGVSSLKEAFPVDPKRIREIFLHPRVTDSYKLNWKKPNVEGVFDFLCREKNFSEERLQKALEKMVEGITKSKKNVTLETFFG
jgi:flap endonuclease-1